MSIEMKDSGIDWIGEIPKHWEIEKPKNMFSLRKTKGNKEAVLLAATQKYGMYPQSQLDGVVKVSADTDLQSFKTVHRNDYVISLRSFQGGFEMSDYEGVCTPAYQVFFATTPINHRYYKFLFKTEDFVSKLNSFTIGIREGKNIQYEDFARLTSIPVPQLNEQSRIANFLDKKCAEIDELIALQEQMIAQLNTYKQAVITEIVTKGLDPNVKMKDSGVEWIGEIPEHWNIAKLNYFVSKVGSGSTPTGGSSIYVSEGVKFLRSQNVHFEGLDLTDVVYISKDIDEGMKGTRVLNGDVLLNITGGSIGRCYYVDESLGAANVNQHVCIIRPEKFFTVYLKYFLQSNIGQTQVKVLQNGGNREGLSAAAIKSFSVLNLSLSEQQSIAQYLDQKCKEIDELISIKKEKIEHLKAYKKSVIYEYVTGKKQVFDN